MKIIDISLTIHNGMPVWPGDDEVSLEKQTSIEKGDHVNISTLTLSVHTGTHVDAPHHFIDQASKVHEMPLDALIGPVQVVEVPSELRVINTNVLMDLDLEPGIKRILFKTTNSKYWDLSDDKFQTDFVAVDRDGAEELVRRGYLLVGIDYLSVSPFNISIPTHMALLSAGIVILEGVDLRNVTPGTYDLVCLPLKLFGSDGAPVRAVLIEK